MKDVHEIQQTANLVIWTNMYDNNLSMWRLLGMILWE